MTPSTCRNPSRDRNAVTIRLTDPGRWRDWATTNAVTSPAVRCSRSSLPCPHASARSANGRTRRTFNARSSRPSMASTSARDRARPRRGAPGPTGVAGHIRGGRDPALLLAEPCQAGERLPVAVRCRWCAGAPCTGEPLGDGGAAQRDHVRIGAEEGEQNPQRGAVSLPGARTRRVIERRQIGDDSMAEADGLATSAGPLHGAHGAHPAFSRKTRRITLAVSPHSRSEHGGT